MDGGRLQQGLDRGGGHVLCHAPVVTLSQRHEEVHVTPHEVEDEDAEEHIDDGAHRGPLLYGGVKDGGEDRSVAHD